MGKRELLLILAFVTAGIVLYRVSAPPTRGSRLGVADLARRLVRELRPESARSEQRRTARYPVGTTVREVRVRGVLRVTATGEDRTDVAAELIVTSTGVDEAEAARLASATTLRADTTADALLLGVDYPAEGQQQVALTVRLPARLSVRVDGIRGELRVNGVAGVALGSTRGAGHLSNIAGLVEGDHRGGTLELADVGAVRLRARAAGLRLERVRGAVALDLTAGSVRASGLDGPVQVDARSADVELDRLAGPVDATVVGGRFALARVAGAVRCDAEGVDVRLGLARAVEVTAYATRGALDVTLAPSGNVVVDAAATEGSVRLEGLDLPVTVEGRSSRAAGPVGRGGPRVSLRATRGGITIRSARAAPATSGDLGARIDSARGSR